VSRAQQILYGATLHAHLHGQQIGGALLAEGTVTPHVVLTDLVSMLHVRHHTKLPVAIVRPAEAGEPTCVDAAGGFRLGDATVQAHPSDVAREDDLRETLATLAAAVDLREPFERIRAAIDEAQRR